MAIEWNMEFLQHNLYLVAIAVAAFFMLVWPTLSRKIYGIKEVGVLETTQLINHHDAVVVDVREERELAEGRLPGAKHIPLGQIGSRLGELEKFKQRPLVVVCRSGARSASACKTLRKNGFEQVYNLGGGISAWRQANMPMEKK